jgi:AcrR family transcriptional regulator
MTAQSSPADIILEAAVRLANTRSWERLYLHEVAKETGIPLHEIHEYYSQKDDLVEAWYDRADKAMLKAAQAPGYNELMATERLHLLIMRWLDTLAAYKNVSRDMLLYKLEPAHIHLQLQGIQRISRTVQWLREAALQDATHLRRIIEEIGLTTLYLNTFIFWMTDNSANQERTRRFLHRRLASFDKCNHLADKFRWLIPGSVTHRSQKSYSRQDESVPEVKP